MAFNQHQAEAYSYVTGQAAESHSHNYFSRQTSQSHFPVLDGVGALFPSLSASQKGSQDDSNSHFDDDEAFGPQANRNDATVPAALITQMGDTPGRDRPGPYSSLTPRGTPVHDLPYLPPEEIPELRRRRAAQMKPILTLCYHRPALEDTPKHSPVDTNFTSVDAGSENNFVYHEHTQAPSWDDRTLSNQSIESEYGNESEEHISDMEQNICSVFNLPESTYNTVDEPYQDADR